MQKQDQSSGFSSQILMNMFDQHHKAMRNQAFTSAGLAIATTTTQWKTANTVTYTSGGVFKSKAAADNNALAALTITANGSTVQEAVWLILLDGAGTLTTVVGAIATGAGNALLPELSAWTAGEQTSIGYIRIATTAGGGNFVAGTTALNAGGFTVTYVNTGFVTPRFDAAQ
jgi:hypothetical protein